VFLFGDFFQLPPPGNNGLTLYDAVVKKQVFCEILSEAVSAAADVFVLFKQIELTENERVKHDPFWGAVIEAIRTKDPFAYPIRDHVIKLLDKMVLTAADVSLDPLWRTAPVVVSGNIQRTDLIMARAPSIALSLNEAAITWRFPLIGDVGESLTDAQAAELYRTDPRLSAVFIRGYKGYLNSSLTSAATDRHVSNGTPFVYHSLTLDSESSTYDSDLELLNGLIRSGEVVQLGSPPLSVNIELIDRDPSDFDDSTLVSGRSVVPLLSKKSSKDIKCFLPNVGTFAVSFVAHECDNGAAFTGYKAQGN